MPYDADPNYHQMLSHTNHHGLRRWLKDGYRRGNIRQGLLDGARHEDAQTIGGAIRRMPEHRLLRRIARLDIDEMSDGRLSRKMASLLTR